jgi:hypothetical protein
MADSITYLDLSANDGSYFVVDPDTFKGKYYNRDGTSSVDVTDPKSIEGARLQFNAHKELGSINLRNTPQTAATAATAATADPELTSQERAALLDYDKFSQRRDLQRNLGPAALIGGLGAAVQVGQAIAPGTLGNVQDRYAAGELERLQRKQARGQLGLTQGERGEMERQMMNPVRTMARDVQRAGEQERASTGVVTSAAGQVRAERERQRLIADQARQAGASIAAADMQRADQELKKMESLTAYRGQRQQQAIANLQKTGMDIAYLAGLSRAGKGMEQIDPQSLVQANGNNVSQAVEMSKDLSRASSFGISEREVRQIGKKYGLSGAATDGLVEQYTQQRSQPGVADRFRQGKQTQREAVGLTGNLGEASKPMDTTNAPDAFNFVDKDEELFEMTPPTQRNIDRSVAQLNFDKTLTNEQKINSLVNQFGMSEEKAKSALGIKE